MKYEEEFDLKHLDLVNREINEYLETVDGFLKFDLNGSDLYLFGSMYQYFGQQTHTEIASLYVLMVTVDDEKIKITMVPGLEEKLHEKLKDMKSKIVWSQAISCPHCKARYVYKGAEKESGSLQCKNCLKTFTCCIITILNCMASFH